MFLGGGAYKNVVLRCFICPFFILQGFFDGCKGEKMMVGRIRGCLWEDLYAPFERLLENMDLGIGMGAYNLICLEFFICPLVENVNENGINLFVFCGKGHISGYVLRNLYAPILFFCINPL